MQKEYVCLRYNYICVLKHYSVFWQDEMQVSFAIIKVYFWPKNELWAHNIHIFMLPHHWN